MKPQHVLVFRLSSLGDVAMCVPVVMNALEQNPSLKIDFVTPKSLHSFFPKHKRLKLIDFDKKNRHQGLRGIYTFFQSLNVNEYTAYIDFHLVLRSHVLKLLFKSKGVRTVSIDKGRKEKRELVYHTNFKPLKPTTERYADVLRSLGVNVKLDHLLKDFHQFHTAKSQAIGVAPFAAHEGKMYSIKSMRQVVERLQETNPIKVFGSKRDLNKITDWETMRNVTLVHADSFYQEMKIMASLQLMISMDSANMHIASLVGIPVISIWGVTHPYAGFLGYGQRERNIIQDNTLKWRPTSIYGNKLGPKENPNGMKNITPQQIIDKVYFFLNT